jgi:RimJ/RimL family protein N-acetyltransferase
MIGSGEMNQHVRLRDGTNAVIRPYLPIPRKAIEEAYSELSLESRYHRFLTTVPHLTDTMLHHLVDEIDGVNHIALVLVLEPDQGPDSIIGVARIIRYPHEPTSADIAVTVREEWHGRGAATALLEALVRQRPEGVTRIVTLVAVDNEASLAMLRRLGDSHTTATGHGTLDVVVNLTEALGRDGTSESEPDGDNT